MADDDPSRRWPPRLTVGSATALITLVAGAVALVLTLAPRLAPDPGVNYRADIEVMAVDRQVTLGEHLRRTSVPPVTYARRLAAYRRAEPGNPSDEEVRGNLSISGASAYVSLTIEGFKRRSVTLRWSMYDARRRRRVTEEGYSNVPVADVRGEAPTDRTVVEVWTEAPLDDRSYFLRLALYDKENGTMLDVADSKPFRGWEQ